MSVIQMCVRWPLYPFSCPLSSPFSPPSSFLSLFCTQLGEARIRVQISAVHSTQDNHKCLEAFKDIGRKQGVIS